MQGCKRENDDVEIADEDKISVQLAMGGIMDVATTEIQASSNPSSHSLLYPNNAITSGDGYIIETSNENTSNNSSIKSTLQNRGEGNRVSSVTPIAVGIKVNLLLYEVEDNGDLTYKSVIGVPVQQNYFAITLVKNTKYRYFVYSYNNFDVYPPFPSDPDNPVIPTRTDFALIYASGDINVQEVPVHVNVVFRHITSRISIGVDAQSYFANAITALNVNLNNVELTTHNLNIKTGNFIGGVQSSIQSNFSFDFANFENSPAKKLSQNRLYTSTPLNSYSYTITRLEVNKNNVNEVLISPANPRPITVTGFSGPLTTVYFSRNYIYPATNVGGNIWAKGNLFYQAGLTTDKQYQFAEPLNIRQSENCNYYFDYKALSPRSQGSSPNVGDPCALVYPMGKWKTPSKTDYENLIAGTVLETFGAGGVQYRNTTTDQKVTFNEAGWIAGLAGCIVSNTTDGKYWTSTVHETLSTRAYSFEVDNSLSTTFNTVTNDYDRSAMSIRCVRVL